jgi:hypothetical protein
MIIDQMINELTTLKEKCGPDIEVCSQNPDYGNLVTPIDNLETIYIREDKHAYYHIYRHVKESDKMVIVVN